MSNSKKRCSICSRWYRPDKRTQQHQTCCRKASCRKKRKARANKSWRTRHPGYDQSRKLKKRDWAQKNDYWRRYRHKHPAYCDRDNRRRKASRNRLQNAANQDAIRKISVDKLKSIPPCEPEYAANQDMMDRRVDKLVNYLLWKEHAANQNSMVCLGRDKP